MATYVLVGGAWIGAWAWRDVARRLRAQGHEVYPLSLTGLGDRAHLASPEIDLETHVADIVTLLESENLRDAILVAHSYSAMPVTGAADRVADRIKQLVYVDCAPIPSGMAFIEVYAPAERELVERQVKEQGGGWRWPLPTWAELETVLQARLEGIDEAQRDEFRARATAHPFGTFTQPLRLTRSGEPLPKLGVLCSFSEAQLQEMIAAGHAWTRAMSGPEWRYADLLTSHWPMFSKPAELAGILDGAGRQ